MEDETVAARRRRRGRQRNRGRFGGLYKLLSLVLILAAIVAGCTVFFRVDEIRVSGQERYTEEEIVQAAGVELRDNLFLLNKIRIGQQIISRLPYVDEVVIYRDWPDTLVIEVRESQGAAAVESLDAWWILDVRGKIVERTDRAGASEYPTITGLTPVGPTEGALLSVVEEESRRLQGLTDLMKVLSARGMLEDVDSFDLTAGNEISMGYLGRFTVKLPVSGADYDRLIRAADMAITDYLSESDTGVLDMTLEDPRFIPYS